PFGLLVRRTLPETFERPASAAPPRLHLGLRANARIVVLGLVMLAATTISALTTLGLPAAIAFGVAVVNGTCSVVFELLSGWLSDRFGRKPVMIVPCILLMLSIYPAFWIIGHYRTPWALY